MREWFDTFRLRPKPPGDKAEGDRPRPKLVPSLVAEVRRLRERHRELTMLHDFAVEGWADEWERAESAGRQLQYERLRSGRLEREATALRARVAELERTQHGGGNR